MAGSSMEFEYDVSDGIHRAVVTWVSDSATGAVTGTTEKIVGTLIKGVTNPGPAAPTDDYDITLKAGDTNGQNLLGSSADNLIDRDTINTEEVYFNIIQGTTETGSFPVVCDRVFISITNAGNSKSGVLELFFIP